MNVVAGCDSFDVTWSNRLTNTTTDYLWHRVAGLQFVTGYTYQRARYHDPAVGRFISVDTVQPNAVRTQGYNLYAYTASSSPQRDVRD